jgi:hypothetical protein
MAHVNRDFYSIPQTVKKTVGAMQRDFSQIYTADYTISKSVVVAKDQPRCSLDICKG